VIIVLSGTEPDSLYTKTNTTEQQDFDYLNAAEQKRPGVGICLTDGSGRIVHANSSFHDLVGVTERKKSPESAMNIEDYLQDVRQPDSAPVISYNTRLIPFAGSQEEVEVSCQTFSRGKKKESKDPDSRSAERFLYLINHIEKVLEPSLESNLEPGLGIARTGVEINASSGLAIESGVSDEGSGLDGSNDDNMRDAELFYSEWKKVREELEELRKMKHDFMLLTSHELKTPLTVLDGTLELFKKEKFGQLTKQQIQKFEDMSRNLERVKELGTSMYSLSRSYESSTEDMVPCNLSSMLEKVADDIKILATEKKQEIHCDVPSGIMFTGYEKSLYNLFSKLLDNAVRYTPEGGEVFLSLLEMEKSYQIMVKDTGIGIPADLCERIFDELYEISDIMHHKNGFGLGLSIAKKIVRNHGGEIKVESKENSGSAFYVMLPKNLGMENSDDWKFQISKRMCLDFSV